MLRSLALLFLCSLIILNLINVTECDKSGNIPKQSIRSLDVKKTQIFGPGLRPDKVVLPVRYFIIEPHDAHNNR